MTHPQELLADFVDGTLGDDERAVVLAHLEGCPACREEVELARAAVNALSGLPEVPVPLGVTGPVLSEAGTRLKRRRAALWTRVQWAAGAAAAAALVLVVAVSLTGNGGGGDARRAAGGATGATGGQDAAAELAAPAAGRVRLERQAGVSYDAGGVESLAADAARALAPADGEATTGGVAAGGGANAELVGPAPAVGCLRRSQAPVDDPRDTLVRLIEAEFDGTPAYFAVFLESPGAGQPPDTVVVWVTARDDCDRILNLTSHRI